jgi:hypothetical protein
MVFWHLQYDLTEAYSKKFSEPFKKIFTYSTVFWHLQYDFDRFNSILTHFSLILTYSVWCWHIQYGSDSDNSVRFWNIQYGFGIFSMVLIYSVWFWYIQVLIYSVWFWHIQYGFWYIQLHSDTLQSFIYVMTCFTIITAYDERSNRTGPIRVNCYIFFSPVGMLEHTVVNGAW